MQLVTFNILEGRPGRDHLEILRELVRTLEKDRPTYRQIIRWMKRRRAYDRPAIHQMLLLVEAKRGADGKFSLGETGREMLEVLPESEEFQRKLAEKEAARAREELERKQAEAKAKKKPPPGPPPKKEQVAPPDEPADPFCELVFERLVALNGYAVRFILGEIAEDYLSETEIVKRFSSAIYHGAPLKLGDLKGFLSWLQWLGYLKLVGFRYKLTTPGVEERRFLVEQAEEEFIKGPVVSDLAAFLDVAAEKADEEPAEALAAAREERRLERAASSGEDGEDEGGLADSEGLELPPEPEPLPEGEGLGEDGSPDAAHRPSDRDLAAPGGGPRGGPEGAEAVPAAAAAVAEAEPEPPPAEPGEVAAGGPAEAGEPAAEEAVAEGILDDEGLRTALSGLSAEARRIADEVVGPVPVGVERASRPEPAATLPPVSRAPAPPGPASGAAAGVVPAAEPAGTVVPRASLGMPPLAALGTGLDAGTRAILSWYAGQPAASPWGRSNLDALRLDATLLRRDPARGLLRVAAVARALESDVGAGEALRFYDRAVESGVLDRLLDPESTLEDALAGLSLIDPGRPLGPLDLALLDLARIAQVLKDPGVPGEILGAASAEGALLALHRRLGRMLGWGAHFAVQVLHRLGIFAGNADEVAAVPDPEVRAAAYRLGYLDAHYADGPSALAAAARAIGRHFPAATGYEAPLRAFARSLGCEFHCRYRFTCSHPCRERLPVR